MNPQEPAATPDEQRTLYEAATCFRNMGCWNWVTEDHLFGIMNPETGETGYCCVLGQMGEFYGLAVYLGTEGLAGLIYMKTQRLPANPAESLAYQKCLMASFEDREIVPKPDRDLIRDLGLKFRGRGAWPLFRSYLPGYHPWYLTGPETRFLTLSLEQAAETADRLREDPDLLMPPSQGHFLVRVSERSGDRLEWRDEWRSPDLPEAEARQPVVLIIDEHALNEIKQTASPVHNTLEIDCFSLPTTVMGEGGGRPYYPVMFLAVEKQSGYVLGSEILPSHDFHKIVSDKFMALLREIKVLPRIEVRREDLHALLKPIASALGMSIKRVKRLKSMEEAQNSLTDFLGGRFPG
ncbi:MAG: hypothetical protein IT210_05010 [Armatimonadetes bacterium]|nr:hypothetical protein [Armatimonadota bacterium]